MKTCLFEKHLALKAKMVDFCGWQLPLHYPKGTIYEHLAVRKGVGLFDISHMGRISIVGDDAETLLNYLSTNQIQGRSPGSVTYTVFSNTTGGSVDDALVFKEDSTNFFIFINSFNREKVLSHLMDYAKNMDVVITSHFDEGMIALQGPRSPLLIGQILPEAIQLKYMHFIPITYRSQKVYLCRTGYTGSIGFELVGPASAIVALWDEFMELGQVYGIEAAGIGARDTLRLEMGYALYGQELSETIAPTESVSAWQVKWNKPDFLGKEALDFLETSPKKRYQYGVIVKDRQIAKVNSSVSLDDELIGFVTSGNYSPILNEPIAIIMVDCPLYKGQEVKLDIRSQKITGEVVDLPFVPIDCKQIEKMVRDRQSWFRSAKTVYLNPGSRCADRIKELTSHISSLGYKVVNKELLEIDISKHSAADLERKELARLDQAAYAILDCTEADAGYGRAIEYARTKGFLGKVPAKVLCLYDNHHEQKLSYMIKGMSEEAYPHVQVSGYENMQTAKSLITQFIENDKGAL
ncbi:MAG: glycine cleavage system aminomethyltransferase GcvT [Parachlamydiales bacterium]|nr:glycine cleavage system aminomethyltransferase GcvT [Parachlamydiales bacterium]